MLNSSQEQLAGLKVMMPNDMESLRSVRSAIMIFLSNEGDAKAMLLKIMLAKNKSGSDISIRQ